MKPNRFLPSIFLFLVLVSCETKKQDHFSITGEIAGLGNSNIYVLKFIDGIQIDSIQSIGSKFNYSGKVESPIWVQFMIVDGDNSEKIAEFMLENSNIEIEGKYPLLEETIVTGSYSNTILEKYFEEDKKFVDQWNQIKMEYDLAKQEMDTLNSNKLRSQLNDIVLKDRIGLLKDYVAEYNNEEVGALLPNFCTLGEVLTPQDYTEMYNSLSEQMKITEYGKSIQSNSLSTE